MAALNLAVANHALSTIVPTPPVATLLMESLQVMSQWIDDIPPIQQPMRYGNKAFRVWHSRLVREAPSICERLVGPAAAIELAPYLSECFGNATRIDYGTGHETTFIIFLLCLCKCGAFSHDDLPALGLRVFPAYITLARRLQRSYWLEPAGSHGVWSLDDYHFLVFLFGSSQLQNHPHIKPRSIHNTDVLEGYGREFMYLEAVSFINEVKSGAPFAEHSPILNDISSLASWSKVNEGLAKMYRGEVLCKLPVAQHFLFGSLWAATWVPSRTPQASESAVPTATTLPPRLFDGTASDQMLLSVVAIPEDGVTAVAPWVSSPRCPHINKTLCDCSQTSAAEWRASNAQSGRSTSDSGGDGSSVGQGDSPVTTFLHAFGPVPHVTPREAAQLDAADTVADSLCNSIVDSSSSCASTRSS